MSPAKVRPPLIRPRYPATRPKNPLPGVPIKSHFQRWRPRATIPAKSMVQRFSRSGPKLPATARRLGRNSLLFLARGLGKWTDNSGGAMTLITRHTFRVPRRCVLFLLAALATLPLQGQEPHVGLPQDWSTRHVILTNAASPAVAAAASRDPRTWINGLLHRPAYLFSTSSRIDGLLEKQVESDEASPSASGWQGTYSVNRRSRIDWAVSLGPTGGLARGESPAKFGFRPTGAPDCTNDFVVYR